MYETQQAPQFSPVYRPMFCHAATGSYDQAGQEETPEVTQPSRVSSLPTESVKDLKGATASTRSLNASTGCQSGVPHPGQTSQHTDFETQQERTQTLPTCENDRRHLSELMEARVLPCYSTLRLTLKVRLTSSCFNFNIHVLP